MLILFDTNAMAHFAEVTGQYIVYINIVFIILVKRINCYETLLPGKGSTFVVHGVLWFSAG